MKVFSNIILINIPKILLTSTISEEKKKNQEVLKLSYNDFNILRVIQAKKRLKSIFHIYLKLVIS